MESQYQKYVQISYLAVAALVGFIFFTLAMKITGTYDLVLANIIARILIDLSGDLEKAVAPGGTLVLSGIISMREPAVRRTFDGLALVFDKQIQIDDWLGMIYRKPAANQETNGTT